MERTVDTELLASRAGIEAEGYKPAYPPSWIDRVTDWVQQLPIPAWSFFSMLALALVFVDVAVNWSDGSFLTSSAFPFHVVSALSPAIIVTMIYYFDEWAGKALATFRPAMAVEEVEYEDLHYRLTTMPRLPTMIATLIGIAYGVIYVSVLYDSRIDPLRVFTSPAASAFDVALGMANYVVYAMIIYHTVHQMRMISRVYGKCKHIDLFHLSPLYAFATLAARVSIALGVNTYAWIYAFSSSSDIVSSLTPVVAIPLLFATFILPLQGIHALLQEEKTRLHSENALQLRAALKELHHRREAGEYEQIDGVSKAIDSLIKEQAFLKEIPTWPWHPDTVRWVATALLAPVLLALVTRLAQHVLGF